ncbi:hypothetical protein GFS24_09085 [Chitinophaga sp. SYP-B3965]|uniref:hypothetical protein n=1 Tax=Chitinophaga sp. SYP-B3965 TaxID=2663120 RepID=UPI0012999A1A|nr:hypothetical protein [Chitinophaga sp. SYP-B3965]MRG45268.1 hypothetical protein [Chitinophaga sp. SYP-B3965]
METIIIKRSTDAHREASLGCLLLVAIPVVGYLYAMFTTNNSHDALAYGIIATVFLLPFLIDFISTKIPLKAAMIISNEGIALSPSKSLYGSFAFLQKFQARRKKSILWEDITGFSIVIYEGNYTVSPTDGTGSTTYTVPKHQLCIAGKTNIVFSIHGLDRKPDEILALCNQFLTAHFLIHKAQ